MSTDSNSVCNQAIVKEIQENHIYVEMTISSACSACHAKGACGAADKKQEKLKVPCSDPTQFKVGEIVNVELKKSLGRKAVLIAYFFPFLVMVLTLLITYSISKNELLSVGLSFAFTAIYYLIISKLKDKFEKEFVLTVKKHF
ncbi:MAG: hypothetical protein CVU02_00070 [Bacteroidetes bacterium HGW-Bacteroidetes-19]|nr:MAG: hypothetical protein CVU04_01345 [Bacteroidetes bacterium HGW-Bacteroidetes-20]PKP28680.1 MAG: hypothetical protein CVU02_00070 [Bacteroidetes bacterium HGW-Bacteroidetes-19]